MVRLGLSSLSTDISKRVEADAESVAVGRVTSAVLATKHPDGTVGVYAYPQLVKVRSAASEDGAPIVSVAIGDHVAMVTDNGILRIEAAAQRVAFACADLITGAWLDVDNAASMKPKAPRPSSKNAVVMYTSVRSHLLVGYMDKFYMVEYKAKLMSAVVASKKSQAAAGPTLEVPTAASSYQRGDEWRGVIGCANGGLHLFGPSVLFGSVRVEGTGGVQALGLTYNTAVAAAGSTVNVFSTQYDHLIPLQTHAWGGVIPRAIACSSDAAFVALAAGTDIHVFRTVSLRNKDGGAPDTAAIKQTVARPVSSIAFVAFLARLQNHWLKDPDFRNTLVVVEGGAALALVDVCDPGDTWWPKGRLVALAALILGALFLALVQP